MVFLTCFGATDAPNMCHAVLAVFCVMSTVISVGSSVREYGIAITGMVFLLCFGTVVLLFMSSAVLAVICAMLAIIRVGNCVRGLGISMAAGVIINVSVRANAVSVSVFGGVRTRAVYMCVTIIAFVVSVLSCRAM